MCYIWTFYLLSYLIGKYLECDKRYLLLKIFRLQMSNVILLNSEDIWKTHVYSWNYADCCTLKLIPSDLFHVVMLIIAGILRFSSVLPCSCQAVISARPWLLHGSFYNSISTSHLTIWHWHKLYINKKCNSLYFCSDLF